MRKNQLKYGIYRFMPLANDYIVFEALLYFKLGVTTIDLAELKFDV